MPKILIKAGPVTQEAELLGTQTAASILEKLPIYANANTWGDEVYFEIPVFAESEDPRETVEIGDVAYWPPGQAFCIFFGRTPMSRGSEILPASPVNVFGRLLGDPAEFRKVSDGDPVTIESID